MIKKLLLAAAMVSIVPASAQQFPPNYIGRSGAVTTEVCVTPVVTAGLYIAGNVVGGLITFPNAFLSSNAGHLNSVRLTFKSVQTVEFDVTFFASQPSGTFTDKTAPAITASDALLANAVIKLTNNFSGLGTHTVYGIDTLNRGVRSIGTSAYAVVTTTGTPTLTATNDMQLCASWAQD